MTTCQSVWCSSDPHKGVCAAYEAPVLHFQHCSGTVNAQNNVQYASIGHKPSSARQHACTGAHQRGCLLAAAPWSGLPAAAPRLGC